ncbi:MAG: hypothetical protein VXY75_02280 [Bacteroidota bacterium]|nr:hypothetical protein [Bacteroidota bacterium]MEC8536199.1 hypothetical protein [Bacteroidota bacterium]
MANIRNLKKDINYVLGDIIEAVYVWETAHPDKNVIDSEVIIDEAIETFDTLIEKVNAKNIGSPKTHFKAIVSELEKKRTALIEKLNKL